MKLALLLRTLPHLRWEQLAYRPWRRAQFSLYRAWPGLTARWTTADKAAPNFPPPQTIESFQRVFETELAHLRAPLETAAARWADVPDTWECPDCGAEKADFRPVPVAAG